MPKQPVTIGQLRHRITIQRQDRLPDGQGGSSVVWSTFKVRWAQITPVSSNEQRYAAAVQYRRSHKMVMRYLDGLDTNMQILFDGRTFQIKGFIQLVEQRFWMNVDLEENVGT